MKAADLIPTPKAVAKEIVLGIIAAIAVAFIIGHVPALKAWIAAERGE
jgi:hypothetical protein